MGHEPLAAHRVGNRRRRWLDPGVPEDGVCGGGVITATLLPRPTSTPARAGSCATLSGAVLTA